MVYLKVFRDGVLAPIAVESAQIVWVDRKYKEETMAADTIASIPLSADGVWRYNGTPDSWTQIGGPAFGIYGGGEYGLVATMGGGDIYHYLGSPNNWERIGGPGRDCLALATFVVTNDTVYGLCPDDSRGYISRYNGTPDSWIQIGGPIPTDMAACP